MTDGQTADVQWEWARLLLDALASAGVRDVLVSPGSRSTPFVLAAAQHPHLVCRDIHDERAAGFFALGLAKATERVPLLLCTSGTAAAHYLPSIIEAEQSYTPLVVLSADRPIELQGCGAPQTIDQVKLFGSHVRHFADLGAPKQSLLAYRALRRNAMQAVHSARHPVPGPVHLNARAHKPLEPRDQPESTDFHEAMRSSMTVYPPTRRAEEPATEALVEACSAASRGLIVCGPAHVSQVRARGAVEELAVATGFPVLAEATSQLRFGASAAMSVARCDAFDSVLRSGAGQDVLDTDLILQLGAAPTSSAWDAFVAGRAVAQRRRFVIAPYGLQDPSSVATDLVVGDPEHVVRALASAIRREEISRPRERDAWTAALMRLEPRVWSAVHAELEASGDDLSEGGATRAVLGGMPQGALLFVGNSLPVRHVDRWCRSGSPDVVVVSQRGANGIDGLVSGAAGAAFGSRRATVALLGDVSMAHDLTGLLVAREVGAPFVLVVLNNDGGRIFEELTLAAEPQYRDTMHHFTTPHGLTFEPAATMFGHRYVAPKTLSALRGAVAEACARPGCTVVEAIVPAHGAREQARRMHERIAEVVESARRERGT